MRPRAGEAHQGFDHSVGTVNKPLKAYLTPRSPQVRGARFLVVNYNYQLQSDSDGSY
jgi:hypothetical protein